MNDPNHPIWFLARIVVFLFALVVVLKLNVNSFDADEKEIVKWFLGAAIGASGLEYGLRRIINGKE